MICPKCQKEQSSTVECEHCGVVFEKFAKRSRQERVPSVESSALVKSGPNRMLLWGSSAVAIGVLLIFYLLISGKSSNSSKNTTDNVC
jgi:uncharacterized membrane protein YvbJ